jgi:hypothetical protein
MFAVKMILNESSLWNRTEDTRLFDTMDEAEDYAWLAEGVCDKVIITEV